MINRKMKFLDMRCESGRHTNTNLGQGLELSARRARQGYDRHASGPRDFGRPANIGGIS